MKEKINAAWVMRSATRTARILRALTFLLSAIAGLAVLLSTVFPKEVGGFLLSNTVYNHVELMGWQLTSLLLIGLIQIFLWALALELTRASFVLVASDDATSAARTAAKASKWLWIGLVWSILAQVPFSAVATWMFPVGERMISISFGSMQLSMLFAALLVGFFSHLLSLGAALWQDHKEVI